MRRREFITLLGAAAAWPFTARAQPAMPVIGFIDGGSADGSATRAAAFRKGLNETGYVEGQNVMVEYHYLEGQYDRLPALMADLVRRRVAVIVTPGSTPAVIAAKRAALLHELVPKDVRFAVLLNPANPSISRGTALRDVQESARARGMHIHV